MYSPRGWLTLSGSGLDKVPAALSETQAAGSGHGSPHWTSAPSLPVAYQVLRAACYSGAILEGMGHTFLCGPVGQSGV